MIHAKFVKPRAFPWNSARAPEQIDRMQDIGGDLSLNRERQYEIGREAVLDYKKAIPSFTYTGKQFEFGSMSFWYDLANKVNPSSGNPRYITESDLKVTLTDIAAFLTDDNNVFAGTIWFPKLRVGGFSLNIGNPDAIVERNFSLIGEDYKIISDVTNGVGKYLAYQTATASGSGSFDKTLVLSPAAIAYAASTYIFRVLRIRSGVATELLHDEGGANNTYSFNFGTQTVTVKTCQNGDIVKVYYPSATAYTTTWTDNNADSSFLLAEDCEIRLKVGTSERIYRLQSVGIDLKFDRTDYREIGNSEYIQFGVRATTVSISLNRYNENFTLENILASDTTYPFINPRDFADDIQMQVKIFSDKTHTTFKMGYLMNKISPKNMSSTQPVNDYGTRVNTLEADNIKISDLESELAFA